MPGQNPGRLSGEDSPMAWMGEMTSVGKT